MSGVALIGIIIQDLDRQQQDCLTITTPFTTNVCPQATYLKTKVIGVGTSGSDDTELEIGQNSQNNEEILCQTLLKGNNVGGVDDLTVAINLACEGPPPKVYDPLSIMISDSRDAMGVQLRDPSEYHSMGPYQGIAGDDGRLLSNITTLKYTEKDSAYDYKPRDVQRWPQMFRILLKPNGYWGLCSSAANGGISLSFSYPKRLRVDDGLQLVLFRNKSTETSTFNMIEVTVRQPGQVTVLHGFSGNDCV